MKKIASILVSFTLIMALLAGCGVKANNEAKEGAATTKPTDSPKPVTLKVFTFTNDAQIRSAADAYKKEHPNVTVDVENVGNDYGPVLKTKLNSGDIPDIFQSQAYSTNMLYKDIVLDLTNEEFMKSIEDNAKTGATLDGKVLGMPISFQAYGFIYNKKLFADAGITTIPKTYKELEEVAIKLKAKNIVAFANDYKEWWVFKHIFTQNMAAEEGNYAQTAKDLGDGKVKFGTGQLKYDAKVFDLIDLTLKYGSDKPLETDFTTGVNMVAEGKAAMIHQGTWAEAAMKKTNPQVDLGFIPEPVGDDASKAKLMVDASVLMRISKTSKNLNEAKDFLKFLNSWIKDNGMGTDIPTVKGAKAPDAQLAKDTVKFVQEKNTYPWVQGYWPDGFDEQMGNLFQAYIAKTKTKEQVLTEMSNQWQKLAKAMK